MAAHICHDPASGVFFIRYTGEHSARDVEDVMDQLETQADLGDFSLFLVDLSRVCSSILTKDDLRNLLARIARYAQNRITNLGQPLLLAYFCPTPVAQKVGRAYGGSWSLQPDFIALNGDRLADCSLFLGVDERVAIDLMKRPVLSLPTSEGSQT